jgi:hypothetical protein
MAEFFDKRRRSNGLVPLDHGEIAMNPAMQASVAAHSERPALLH